MVLICILDGTAAKYSDAVVIAAISTSHPEPQEKEDALSVELLELLLLLLDDDSGVP